MLFELFIKYHNNFHILLIISQVVELTTTEYILLKVTVKKLEKLR